MRSATIALTLLLSGPTLANAQADAADCTTLAVIQSDQCTVRRVVVCADNPADWRNVAIYGSDRPISLSIFNENGVPVRVGSGPGTPQSRLGDQTDPLDLQLVLNSGADTFDYQMVSDTGEITRINGKTRTTGETATIDGRNLAVLQSRQTISPTAGEPSTVDISFLYDADLRLMITDSVRDTTTGEFKQHRTPMDFIFAGETGFDDYVPRFGCEG
jgi:hypothetical protein